MSPPLVLCVKSLMEVMLPLALSNMSAPAAVLVKLLLTLIAPP